ncbi:amidohydrolase family protein [Sphingobium sp. BYY-5]|uniref:amidohydrolase family protein n=1 Tax=Sphingobium sp. BYY-5 TaxID=2926400 RepID=UPI001FA6B8F6|nr:amidohydrolase family protein [Sphingobium sp. BYY-5]MCI4592040.1 amidohydrolase family protein [Sphingobium sp. BYY-5]
MLIRRAEIDGHLADIRIANGRIAAIGLLEPDPDEQVIEAGGGALLPGLHDHHIHCAALAVARNSIACGPPEVRDEEDLARILAQPGAGWLRGVGYHESVAGMLDAATLDRWTGDRPVRIQHRSGRMWFLNSAALDRLLSTTSPPEGMERNGGRWTGRLFDADAWLRSALGGTPPELAAVSAELASLGIIGITDMSPANDRRMAAHFAAEQDAERLIQRIVLAGTLALSDTPPPAAVTIGPAKLHLHEHQLPDFDACVAFLRNAHERGRNAAIHCTTEVELVFALAALEEAGVQQGGRIEHAGITPDILLARMADLGIRVVSQPHFIAERGDQYLADVDPRERLLLYRLAAFRRMGITLAAGSDAPYGRPDPWASMRAAVSRQTASGIYVGEDEALTPEDARDLFLADPMELDRIRRITKGAPADLCLLDRNWAQARARLDANDVRTTIIAGSVVYNRVDKTPI